MAAAKMKPGQYSQAKSRKPECNTRVAKRNRGVVAPGIRRKDGLLNTAVATRPELLEIAKRNSVESPLLRLPGELRDKIWRYALGEHQIDIQDLSREEPIEGVYDIATLYPRACEYPGFFRPTFQLPRVCRQIYVEAAPYVYTLNTFTFHSMATFDLWIKKRCLGQRRLITSLDIPRTYMRLYRSGFRKRFRSKFPNIQRIGVDNWSLFCDYDEMRRRPANKGKPAINMWSEAKDSLISEIKGREGYDIIISWHGHSA